MFPSPESGIINSFISYSVLNLNSLKFPSPESGIINSFLKAQAKKAKKMAFPSPESGIINSFPAATVVANLLWSFRPLSRGLSIPSIGCSISTSTSKVSVP